MKGVNGIYRIKFFLFEFFFGCIRATLEELKVDAKLIGEVMTVVATTKNAVLNRKPAK
jgi:hypothetical protein